MENRLALFQIQNIGARMGSNRQKVKDGIAANNTGVVWRFNTVCSKIRTEQRSLGFLPFDICAAASLQLRVFRLGLLKDGNVGIGVFPQRQEILIRGAALGSFTLHRVGAAKLEMGQRPDGFVEDNPAMVEDFLKLCCGLVAPMCGKIRFSAHIDGVQVRPVIKSRRRQTELIGRSNPENVKGLLRV